METPSQKIISLFKDAFEQTPEQAMPLSDFLSGIKSGAWAEQVADLRQLIAAGNRKDYDIKKRDLPSATLSVHCLSREKDLPFEQKGITHTGWLQADMDLKDNPILADSEVAATKRRELLADPYIHAVFVGPSGQGMKAVIAIPTDYERHEDAWFAAEAHIRDVHGLKLDSSTKNPVRLCFASHDPELAISKDFKPIPVPEEQPSLAPVTTATRAKGDKSDLPPPTAEEIGKMLSHIPPRPDYGDWLKIASAVWSVLPMLDGARLLHQWSPEEKDGEYASKHKSRLQQVGIGSLIHIAKEHGYRPPTQKIGRVFVASTQEEKIPEDIFPVPSSEVSYIEAAEAIFPTLSRARQWFVRGGKIHEVSEDEKKSFLNIVEKTRAVSEIERLAKKFKRRIARREIVEIEENGKKVKKVVWRSTLMPECSMKVLLESEIALKSLPSIRQLVGCPVLSETEKGEIKILERGYHEHAGGTYITGGETPQGVPLKAAVAAIKQIHADFEFCSPSDLSRAIAVAISPALKMGNLIQDDFPMHIAEATESQSGKTYLQKTHATLYCESPKSIVPRKGGVGGLDEDISSTLMEGRPFVSLANFRGKLDSPILEEAIRGGGTIQCRALKKSAEIDTTPFIWQLSTNGAEFTRDIANRGIITRIRKRPTDHAFQAYEESDLIKHIEKNQAFYLGCIFAVVAEWVKCGKPRTDDTRHDFKAWTQSLDWIVQNIMGLPRLLDGHREEQLRAANPALQFLRAVAVAVTDQKKEGFNLSALDLVDICETAEITLPGRADSTEKPELRLGRTLKRVFNDSEQESVNQSLIKVDGFEVRRISREEYDQNKRANVQRHSYIFQ
jgi:hypothetical protein